MNPLLIKSFPAAADTDAYLIIKIGGAGVTASAATSDADAIIGVSGSQGADAGKMLDVTMVGWGEVRLGGTVAAGAPLTADATGKAVAATKGRHAGFAMAAGVIGDIIPIQIAPGFVPAAS